MTELDEKERKYVSSLKSRFIYSCIIIGIMFVIIIIMVPLSITGIVGADASLIVSATIVCLGLSGMLFMAVQ